MSRRVIHIAVACISLVVVVLMTSCSSSVRFTSDHNFVITKRKTNPPKRNSKKDTSPTCVQNFSEAPLPDEYEQDSFFDELAELSQYDPYKLPTTDQVILEAQSWLGTKYCWGGGSKKCTDCSGFTQSIFRATGISLPRTAAMQFNYTKRVKKSKAKRGDLVFFSKDGKISHVGLYVGRGMMIHASSSNGVVLEKIDKPCYPNCAGYGRVPQLYTVR